MKIAVIILNYNSSADCRKCIGFLKKQAGIELEIIVVDNRSNDEERTTAKQLCEELHCTFIANNENRGYNAGNNIGLRYAAEKGYKYALIANPDMEFPQTDYIERLTTRMEQEEQLAICASDIVTPEGIHQSPMYKDGDWKSSFGWMAGIWKRKKTDTYDFIDNYHESHYCDKVSGCCFLIRMAFVQSIGYFDENVFLYCEEAILAKQIASAHKKIYYDASAQAIHRHIKSAKGDPIQRFRIWKDSREYFINQYSGDSPIGRSLSKMSLRLYISLLIFSKRIKS